MKIAVVQPRLSYFNGGGEKIPLEAIIHMADLLEDVSFDLYTTKSPLPYSPGYEQFKSRVANNKRVCIFELPTPGKYKSIYDISPGENRYRWDVESLYFNNLVYEQINNSKPDLVLSCYLPDFILHPKNVPSILYLLGYPRSDSEYREAMLAQYDAIVAITQTTLDQWNTRLTTRIEAKAILHQGVDLTRSTTKIKTFDSTAFNIVFAGRLIEKKGVTTLLDAVLMLEQEGVNFRLHILGEGPMAKSINEFVVQNNLQSKVVLEGFKNNITDYLSSADLCVFPSLTGEGLMNVVLESMYYNGLVITTKGNGNEEAITDGLNGYLVTPGDTDGLKSIISSLIHNYKNTSVIKEKAKLTIAENFTWEHHARTLYSICTELLHGKTSQTPS